MNRVKLKTGVRKTVIKGISYILKYIKTKILLIFLQYYCMVNMRLFKTLKKKILLLNGSVYSKVNVTVHVNIIKSNNITNCFFYKTSHSNYELSNLIIDQEIVLKNYILNI